MPDEFPQFVKKPLALYIWQQQQTHTTRAHIASCFEAKPRKPFRERKIGKICERAAAAATRQTNCSSKVPTTNTKDIAERIAQMSPR